MNYYFFILYVILFFPLTENNSQIPTLLNVEYDFYFYKHFGNYKIQSLSTGEHNVQTVVRKFNMQVSPGVIDSLTQKRYLYKDLHHQELIYDEVILNQTVHDDLNTMKWELTRRTEVILGYTCYEAKSQWRGRTYIALFTLELPFKSAPWKFHGLPGVMLKIYSTDKKLKIIATAIKINPKAKAILNPFKGTKSVSWKEYCNTYAIWQKKNFDRLKSLNIRMGKKFNLGSGRIDLITEIDVNSEKINGSELNKVKK